MKEIELTQDQVALVDDQDYKRLNRYWWSITNTGYAARKSSLKGNPRTVLMHRQVLLPNGHGNPFQLVDHIDGNKLNNCRNNLRWASHAENVRNQSPRTHGTSRYKGVTWHKRHRVWTANIQAFGKTHYLGQFTTELAGALAYNKAALEMHGAFAKLNNTVLPLEERLRKATLDILPILKTFEVTLAELVAYRP